MSWSLGGEGLIYGIEKALYAQAGLVWSVHMWTQELSRRCCRFVAALTMQTIEPCNILRRHRDRPTTSHSLIAATLPRSRTASTRARAPNTRTSCHSSKQRLPGLRTEGAGTRIRGLPGSELKRTERDRLHGLLATRYNLQAGDWFTYPPCAQGLPQSRCTGVHVAGDGQPAIPPVDQWISCNRIARSTACAPSKTLHAFS